MTLFTFNFLPEFPPLDTSPIHISTFKTQPDIISECLPCIFVICFLLRYPRHLVHIGVTKALSSTILTFLQVWEHFEGQQHSLPESLMTCLYFWYHQGEHLFLPSLPVSAHVILALSLPWCLPPPLHCFLIFYLFFFLCEISPYTDNIGEYKYIYVFIKSNTLCSLLQILKLND